MTFLRFIRRLAVGFGGIYLLTLGFVIGFAMLQPSWETVNPKADMIVVLGGGITADGRLMGSSSVRVDRGVALFQAGAAEKILFSGGGATKHAPSGGARMAARAIRQGVPSEAILIEERSQSTLQNALFSKADWQARDHIILVSEGFHLARSWASFKAMGAGKITLIHARRFGGDDLIRGGIMVLREALAYWFNGLRYLVWLGAGVLDVPQSPRDALLI